MITNLLNSKNINSMLITDPDTICYLIGFKAIIYSRPIVFFFHDGKKILIVPELEKNHAKEEASVDEIYSYGETAADNAFNIFDILLPIITDTKLIGIDANTLSHNFVLWLEGHNISVVDIGDDIKKMRSIKTESELSKLVESGKLVSLAVNASLKGLSQGISELELDEIGTKKAINHISETHPKASFQHFAMSPSGIDRTILPHVFSNNRIFENNDICIHSRQIGLNNYQAECERTFFINQPSKEQINCFNVMEEASNAVFENAKEGVLTSELDQISYFVFKKYNLEKYVCHRTGHGLGTSFHELPELKFKFKEMLLSNMVFCIEPGIYVPGVGGFRHSDTYIIQDNKLQIITNAPRGLSNLTIKV